MGVGFGFGSGKRRRRPSAGIESLGGWGRDECGLRMGGLECR